MDLIECKFLMIKFLSGSDKDTENFVLKDLSPQRKWV